MLVSLLQGGVTTPHRTTLIKRFRDTFGDNEAERGDRMDEKPEPVVILGAGNLLAADDGVGIHAARALAARDDLPESVRVLDVGTIGPDALALIGVDEAVVILDAVRAGDPPGTLHRLALDAVQAPVAAPLSVHDLGIAHLLAEARLLGRPLRGTLLGVEPARIEMMVASLSAPVAAALPALVAAALREARRLAHGA